MVTKAKGSVSPLKSKNEQLRKTVQGFKLVKLSLNQSELALISELSKGTIHNKSQMIDELWSKDSDTPDDDKKFVLEKSIEIGMTSISGEDKVALEHLFGVILGSYLKVETKILDNAKSLKTVWTIGRHLTSVYKMICRYKKRSVNINSENQSSKYLLKDKTMLDECFNRSDDYQSDKYSKRWTPTDILKTYVQISNEYFLTKLTNNPELFSSFFPSSSPYMSLSNGTKNTTSKKPFHVVREYNIYPRCLVDINILKTFEINSIFSILLRMVEIDKDVIIIPIKHESTKTDEYNGRTYNIFCSLRSYERSQLGYIGYDMSAALQSISLQLINATSNEYPMMWNYAHDPDFKNKIRTEIANDLNIPRDDVKARLTAFAHGSMKGIRQHKHYEVFQAESDRLRREVLKYVKENDPKVLKRAEEQSKTRKDLPEEIDWLDTESKETSKDMRSKASIFFFVWTWYERKIRQAMIDALGNNEASEAIEVLDAVYSKRDIDTKIVEKEIYDQTGFRITIEKE
ncbi:MAG: hypothetical protein LBM64_01260 [Deltaproteobacteria bacterium]|jgi:hypothetical protein|nr:hypothetical protein [Deltaproteobacteria bacterium]